MYVLSLRQSHVHDKDEFEGVVEGKPVNGVDHGFDDGQEGVDDPVLHMSASCFRLHMIRKGHTVSHCVSSALPMVKMAWSDQ